MASTDPQLSVAGLAEHCLPPCCGAPRRMCNRSIEVHWESEQGVNFMAEAWTHNVAVVNGFRMHYITAGSGYPLVCLHGWPQTSYEWRKIITVLSNRLTIVATELSG